MGRRQGGREGLILAAFDLIIFDYDGVVADSELLNNTILADLLTDVGMPTTLDDALSAYVGKRWLDCLALIEARFGPCPEGLHDEWTRRCHARAPVELAPVAGALDFLESRGERRCIASSSPLDWITMGLTRFGLASTFGGPVSVRPSTSPVASPTPTCSCMPPPKCRPIPPERL
ncbi:MAG: hypothetical protein P0Y52_06310 [Candidatus Brevundimonas phytovorans]|nr:HAD hydrolase-like protein [Brevundimonas sp.]WEK59152.1 MAG: hypothetical protein P0Y52_06310 [Brevundimonas sp.]